MGTSGQSRGLWESEKSTQKAWGAHVDHNGSSKGWLWVKAQTWRDVQAARPLSDLRELVFADVPATVQDDAGALVGHAELVGVDGHAGHAWDREVEGGNGVAQLASEGQHEAPQAGIAVEAHAVPPRHLTWTSCCQSKVTGCLQQNRHL